MRLLACGSRRWADSRAIEQQIRVLRDELEVVIEGEATGADQIARIVAQVYGIPVLPFPAAWETHEPGWCRCRTPGRYCPAAGARRNRQMLDEGRPDRVLAFTDDFANPHSGTRGMCRIAVAAGVPVVLVEHGLGGVARGRELGRESFR